MVVMLVLVGQRERREQQAAQGGYGLAQTNRWLVQGAANLGRAQRDASRKPGHDDSIEQT
jgi:hypothetical protein